MAFNAREKPISIQDPRLAPAYTPAEAAHYLRMPQETLRDWVHGRSFVVSGVVSGQVKRSAAIVQLDDPDRKYLSFINLVEAHVLAAMRRLVPQ